MKKYLYETHMHTVQGSACASGSGVDYIRPYMDMGYDGIIITDHFFKGNTRPNRSLPWEEWVNQYCAGYEEAKNEGDKHGFPVFFGIEENFEGDEYLIYGVDKAWLLAHPEIIHWSRSNMYCEVHKAGGCMIQAHPFRSRFYNLAIHLLPQYVDGIEAVNLGNNSPIWNTLAMQYAARLGLSCTCGSDNHHVTGMARHSLGGILVEKSLNSIEDFVSTILNKEPMEMHIPDSAMLPTWQEGLPIDLPVILHGEGNNTLPGDIRHFLEKGNF